MNSRRPLGVFVPVCIILFLSIGIVWWNVSSGISYSNECKDPSCHLSKFGAVAAWLALIPAAVSAIAAAIYAFFFYRLQNQLNALTERTARDNRLIEISTQWNSWDFVQSRNRAYVTICNYKGKKNEMYDELVSHGRLDEWNNISLIACFIERLSRLTADNQVDIKRAQAEFGEAVVFWARFILPVHDKDDADRSLVMALNDIISRFETEQYYHRRRSQ